MPKQSSRYLINEVALQALPTLACLVGLNGAVILQQIHWWSLSSEHKIEGQIWVYNSYKQWAKQFRWLTPRALQKQFLELEKSGYLISSCFAYKGKGRTKWYRINYPEVEKQCENIHLKGELSNNDGEEIHNEGENIHHDSTLYSHKTSLSHAPKNTRSKPENNLRIPEELKSLQNLPYWVEDYQADIVWLSEFKEDFPDFNEKHIRACRDYFDGKRVKHKGQWKSRLRNWLTHDRAYSEGKQTSFLPTEEELVVQAKEKGLIK